MNKEEKLWLTFYQNKEITNNTANALSTKYKQYKEILKNRTDILLNEEKTVMS